MVRKLGFILVLGGVVSGSLFGITLNQKLASVDETLKQFHAELIKTIPVDVDSSEYEKEIFIQLERYKLTADQTEKFRRSRLPEYIKDFRETVWELATDVDDGILNIEIKKRLLFPNFKVQKIFRYGKDQGWPKDLSEPVMAYFENETSDKLSELALVVADWDGGGSRVAEYINPRAQLDKVGARFSDFFEIDGKKIEIKFGWTARLKNATTYLQETLKFLFDTTHIMISHQQPFYKGGLKMKSILVHELRHFFDTVNSFPGMGLPMTDEELEELEASWNRELPMLFGPDYELYITSPEYQKYLSGCVAVQKSRTPELSLAENKAIVEKKLHREYQEDVMERFIIQFKKAEQRGYHDQMRFLRKAGLELQAALALTSAVSDFLVKTAKQVELENGEKVSIIRPSLPLATAFLTRLYEEP